MDIDWNHAPYPRHRALAARVNPRRSGPLPEALIQFCEQLRVGAQIRYQLQLHGCLLRMQVFLRSKIPPAEHDQIAQAFAQAGFLVESLAQAQLVLTAEPCLALTFMLRASEAGVLSDAFEVRLGEILDDGTPLRVERHEEALEGIERMMGSIASVDLPRRQAIG